MQQSDGAGWLGVDGIGPTASANGGGGARLLDIVEATTASSGSSGCGLGSNL